MKFSKNLNPINRKSAIVIGKLQPDTYPKKIQPEHALYFLINSIVSAIVDPVVPTKPREAQLQTVCSTYNNISVNDWGSQ